METPLASLQAALCINICVFYLFGVNEFQINHERSTFMEFQTQNKMINILQLLDILSICFKVSQGQKMVASIQGI